MSSPTRMVRSGVISTLSHFRIPPLQIGPFSLSVRERCAGPKRRSRPSLPLSLHLVCVHVGSNRRPRPGLLRCSPHRLSTDIPARPRTTQRHAARPPTLMHHAPAQRYPSAISPRAMTPYRRTRIGETQNSGPSASTGPTTDTLAATPLRPAQPGPDIPLQNVELQLQMANGIHATLACRWMPKFASSQCHNENASLLSPNLEPNPTHPKTRENQEHVAACLYLEAISLPNRGNPLDSRGNNCSSPQA